MQGRLTWVAALVALLAGAGGASAQEPELAPAADTAGVSDGTLTLSEVYAIARARNPMLRAAAARVDAEAATEPSAGLPPDPMIQVGIMNFSIPGFEADMPNSMAPSVQAIQMVPFPGKLGLSARLAEQSTAMARASAAETWWDVRAMAARAFFVVYETDRQLEVMRETLGLLQDFHQVAQSMYAAGTGRQSDVLRATVEVARMDAEIGKMHGMRRAAVARLNAVLDRPSETPVERAVLPALPVVATDPAVLRAWAEESRPRLLRSRTGVERAETREELARKAIWPDLELGVQYGQRDDPAMGTTRMGSAMVGFSVPVFASSRQLRMRDEAVAMEIMAQAELSAARADVDARIGELAAELDRARDLVTLYLDEILPQAEASVEAAFTSYRVGSVDFMTLVDAQMAANRYEQEIATLLADYGRAVAELEMTVGRELPTGTELIVEDR